MAKLLSGRLINLNLGISSVTEDSRVLTATGDAYIGGNVNIVGITTISGLKFPTSDGSNSQVLSTDGSGNLSFQAISALSGFDWNADTDLGLITDSATTTSDSGLITDSVANSYDLGEITTSGIIYPTQFVLPSFTVSTLPSVSPAGQMLFVTDDTGGAVPAFSDGTNWRRVTDRGIIGSEIALTADYGFIV